MQENKRLESELHALKHDDSYIEQVARGTLSLVREGETVYQFKETER
jgi:cell division protein FtsB